MVKFNSDINNASRSAVDHLTNELGSGKKWPTPLLQSMSMWTTPQERLDGRVHTYLIAGEAFDWLLLAERLLGFVNDYVPEVEKEQLLFTGKFPSYFDGSKISRLLGVEKYRGYLNYYYGITVEESLQLAVELELHKRDVSNGLIYGEEHDYSEESFRAIYRLSKSDLITEFCTDKGSDRLRFKSFNETKEFTYWLFKHRLKHSDKPKIASDTKKGLENLRLMGESPSLIDENKDGFSADSHAMPVMYLGSY